MHKIVFLIFVSGCFVFQSKAGDEIGTKNEWLTSFLKSNLTVATVNLDQESTEAIPYKSQIKIHFDFATKVYGINHFITYKKAWAELTNNGADLPPKMKPQLVGSTLVPWTNIEGEGIFEERLTKEIPNWLVFEHLAEIVSTIAISDYSPAPNGMFRSDELKYLKKMYKSQDMHAMSVWRQLAFDRKGNIIGISSDYLKSKLKITAEYDYISIFNNSGEEIRLSPVESSIPAMVSAVLIEKDNNRIIVLNSELNFSLNKFASFIFPDPKQVKTNYFLAFNKSTKQGLERFENTVATNE